jgi:MOSC domain-containing protein YiiM
VSDAGATEGSVEQIALGPAAGAPLSVVGRARAVPGAGLEGDGRGNADVTLIESEALASLAAETGIRLSAIDSRRNVLVRGVRLNELVGREFSVGEVRLHGRELCEPCLTLERRTQPGVLEGLVHRAGLNADILAEGWIAVGDPVRATPD